MYNNPPSYEEAMNIFPLPINPTNLVRAEIAHTGKHMKLN